MTYCSYLISKYPDVQKKLFEEIEEVKRRRGLNYDSIHQMKYLDAVYKETLRYYPPVIHFINRACLSDITIRDQFYPKGSVVTCLSHTIHRSESNWEEAEVFNPDRFMNENGEEKMSKDGLKWIPFGVGPRYCVGMRFAEMEFKTTIAKLVDTFELSIPEGEPDLIPDCNGVIMRPKDPVRLNLKLRI
uniref:Cytochrome P450 n=1 Tax=Caenorhabditis tropicalis TaxID=1561998 RepID=A0A1I7T7C8_9PELO